jgi:hypothetical protein
MWCPVKTDEERGPVGAWARSARLAAGYATAREAADAAHRAGIPLKLQHLQGIESGWDRAGRELLARLGELYGSDPPGLERDARSALSPAQAAEIRAVVAEAVASAVDARLERIERLLGDLGGGPAPGQRKPRPRR